MGNGQWRKGKGAAMVDVMHVIALGLVIGAAALCGCASTLDQARVHSAHPADEDHPGFNNIFRDGRFYFAGQPDEASLRRFVNDTHTKMIINIRTEDEMATKVDFNERAAAEEMGVEYVLLPVTPATLSGGDVDIFAQVLGQTEGPVLIHCGSSNRVGALWAAYLARYKDMPMEEALAMGRDAGLSSPQMEEAARRAAFQRNDAVGGSGGGGGGGGGR